MQLPKHETESRPISPTLVALDRDHPGFRDEVYRERRNRIAEFALHHTIGDPVPRVHYDAAENRIWSTVLENLKPLHARYAITDFHEGWRALAFEPHAIPQLADVNDRLVGLSGFQLQPVAGLVTAEEFLSHLAGGVFLATQYIRHHSTPLYTPEPDVVHELVGHACLLASPRIAATHRAFGEATRRCSTARMEDLIRLYWYVFEFGVIRDGSDLKALGAGLLSSFGELGHFESEAGLHPFDFNAVVATPFDPTNYQNTLFVGDGVGALLQRVEEYLAKLTS